MASKISYLWNVYNILLVYCKSVVLLYEVNMWTRTLMLGNMMDHICIRLLLEDKTWLGLHILLLIYHFKGTTNYFFSRYIILVKVYLGCGIQLKLNKNVHCFLLSKLCLILTFSFTIIETFFFKYFLFLIFQERKIYKLCFCWFVLKRKKNLFVHWMKSFIVLNLVKGFKYWNSYLSKWISTEK